MVTINQIEPHHHVTKMHREMHDRDEAGCHVADNTRHSPFKRSNKRWAFHCEKTKSGCST